MDLLTSLFSTSTDTVGGSVVAAVILAVGGLLGAAVRNKLVAPKPAEAPRIPPPPVPPVEPPQPEEVQAPPYLDKLNASLDALKEFSAQIEALGSRHKGVLLGDRFLALAGAALEAMPPEDRHTLEPRVEAVREWVEKARTREVLRIAPVIAEGEKVLEMATPEVLAEVDEVDRAGLAKIKAGVTLLRGQLAELTRK